MKLKNKIVALFLTVACAFGLAVAGNAQKVEAADATYTKVTSAPTDWSGTYLIVAEHSKVIFDGSLSTLDAAHNEVSVTIDGTQITGDYSAYEFTIEAYSTGYSIKAASGKYIGHAKNENKLTSSTSALENTITFNNGDVDIKNAGGGFLRWNATNNDTSYRFRYYKSTSYTNQKPIQLYLKNDGPVEELTDAEKLAVAKDSLNLDSNIITSNISLPTIGAYGAEISWESSNDGILDFEGYVERPEEDTNVTLTATITLGDLVETKVFEVVVKGGRSVVTNPVAGTPYKLMLTQENLSKDLFFTGVISGNYISSTEDAADAAIVTLIEVEGGYHLQALVNGEVKYVNGVVSGKYVNVKTQDTPTTVWQYNTTYNTLVSKFTTTADTNVDFYIGTYGTYNTFSMSNISFAPTSFVSHFVKLTAAELEEYNALKVKVGYQVGTKDEAKALRLVAEFNLTAEDLETFESTIAFRVTKGGVADERAVTTLYSSVNPMNDEAELTGAYYAVLTYVNVPAGEYTVEVLVDGEVAATVVATVA